MSHVPAEKAEAEAAWESHKDTIHRLYLSENKTLEEVRDTMAKCFGFTATKSQYERHFKLWKFRKHLKKGEWKAVDHILSKRKRVGKESEVYVDGIMCPAKKVRKETLRNGFMSALERRALAASPQTPDGITICTPAASELESLRLDNLPFLQFQAFLESQVNPPTISATADMFQRHPFGAATAAAGLMETAAPANIIEIIANIPKDIHPGILNHLSKTSCNSLIEDVKSSTSVMRSVMPELPVDGHPFTSRTVIGPDSRDVNLQFIQLTFFLLSNNFLDPAADVSTKIIEWLKNRGNTRLLEYFLSTKGPTFESIAENLFRIAMETENAHIVQFLLRVGLDAKVQVCRDFYGRAVTPLQYAASKGNLTLVRSLIEARVDVNEAFVGEYADWYGPNPDMTPLQITARGGNIDLTRILLNAGAKVNLSRRHDLSALSFAATCGDDELVRILLAAGADVNFKDSEGRTALHAALGSYDGEFDVEKDVKIVERLLEAGAAINQVAPYGDNDLTVLDMAALTGNIKLNQLLLNAGAYVTESALCYAAESDNMELVQLLLDAGAEVNSSTQEGKSALKAAVYNENFELVELLLDAGADVNDGSGIDHFVMDALQIASSVGNIGLVRILLDAGADVNASAAKEYERETVWELADTDDRFKMTALQAAAYHGDIELVQELLNAGAYVNADEAEYGGESALIAAVRSKNSAVARMLLEAGADVNASAREKKGYTALQAAIDWGDSSIIQLLLDAGANIDAPAIEHGGKTPLTAAIEKGDMRLVRLLLTAGVDINNPSAKLWGGTALEAAVTRDDVELVRYLLTIGADANNPQALLAAVENPSNVEIVQTLLAAHYRIYGRYEEKFVYTALQRAIEERDFEVIRILLKTGVDVNTLILYTEGFNWWYERTAFGTAIRVEKEKGIPLVRMLIDAGADLNSIVRSKTNVTHEGQTKVSKETALLAAIVRKNTPLVEFLIQAGADVNTPAVRGLRRTALQAAAETGNFELVEILLKAGADINASPATEGGATALQAAAIGGYVGIASILLEKGAYVDAAAAEHYGRTALEGAAEHGRIDMLALLLNAGAMTDGPGRAQYARALEFASKNGHNALRRYLESHNAR